MKKHWVRIIVLVSLVFLVTLLTSRYFAASTSRQMSPTTSPFETASQVAECAQCHEMRPEVLTWQVSSHDRFPCTVCHVNKKASDYTEKHQNRNYAVPIKSADSIPNAVCLRCHSANRVTSPSGDLLIPHEKHLKAGVTCVKCHYGMVHAKIAERDLSYIADAQNYDTWNAYVAGQISTKAYIQPSMWTCLECHKQANVTRRCGACHSTIPTLPSHDLATWKSEHGKNARSEIGVCANCHSAPGLPSFITPGTGDLATDFARAQEFCYKCHLQRPEMHQKSMLPIHPQVVSQKGTQNCLTCHKANEPQPGEKVPALYCNKCHWFNQ